MIIYLCFTLTLVEVWHLDLASLKSVVVFAEKYINYKNPLHLLVNNGMEILVLCLLK